MLYFAKIKTVAKFAKEKETPKKHSVILGVCNSYELDSELRLLTELGCCDETIALSYISRGFHWYARNVNNREVTVAFDEQQITGFYHRIVRCAFQIGKKRLIRLQSDERDLDLGTLELFKFEGRDVRSAVKVLVKELPPLPSKEPKKIKKQSESWMDGLLKRAANDFQSP